tara:strand:+ start:266 stop:574 length:309 start_codon:yes stop_codon:yes gene_type:complete
MIYYNDLKFKTKEQFIAYFKTDLLVYPDGISTDYDLYKYALTNEYITVIERAPKCVGQGEMMALQSYGKLIAGDWVIDMDYGVLYWSGQEWTQKNNISILPH